MAMCYYDPKLYEIIQGHPACLDVFESKAPEHLKKRGLFMYRHRLSKAFMLAVWVTKNGIFDPLIQVPGENAPCLSDDTLDKFMQTVYPQAGHDIEKVVLDGLKEQGRQDDEMTQQRIETRSRILRDEFNVRVPTENATVLLPNAGGAV